MAVQKKLRVTVTVPEGFAPGDQFMIEVDVPTGSGRVHNTKPIEEMTKDELKREIINANSVLYKAQKRGAAQEIIDKNQARLDAAKELMTEKFPAEARVQKTSDGTSVKVIEVEGRVLTAEDLGQTAEEAAEDTNEETAAEI